MHATPTTIAQSTLDDDAAPTRDPSFIDEYNRRLERATLKALATIDELCDPPPDSPTDDPQQTLIALRSRTLRLRAASIILRQKPIDPHGKSDERTPPRVHRAPQSRGTPTPARSAAPDAQAPQSTRPPATPTDDLSDESDQPHATQPTTRHADSINSNALPDLPTPAPAATSPDLAPLAEPPTPRHSRPLPPPPHPFDGIKGWKDGDTIILARH